MELPKENRDTLEKSIRYSQQDKTLELEAVFRHDVNQAKFVEILKKIKAMKHLVDPEIKETEMLDISFADKSLDQRITIMHNQNIKKYCKTGTLTGIKPEHMEIIKKERVMFTDVKDYGVRFNLKREKGINLSDSEAQNLVRNLKTLNKYFRYKKRYTITTRDKLFNFDLTVVKSSDTRDVRASSQKKRKSDVKPFLRKYIVVPDFVNNRDTWFDELSDNEMVEIMGKKYTELVPKKEIKGSNVFTNKMTYEVELEYIGNKESSKEKNNVILEKFIENVGYILQEFQNNYFLLAESKKDAFYKVYKELVGGYKFSGPNNVSLEYHNSVERSYNDYFNTVNIRKGYSVTDKADGERNLLVINENGDSFMFSRKNVVKATGLKINIPNTILDGEYITKDKDGNPIALFMVFDIYFLEGKDVRDNVLMRSMEERQGDKVEMSRLEYLDQFIDKMENDASTENSDSVSSLPLYEESAIKFVIQKKKFYFGNDDPFDEENEKTISGLEIEIERTSDSYEKDELKEQLSMFKGDYEIFDHCKTIMNKQYVYSIDGLIFTPIDLGVGEEPNVNKRNKYSGRWHRSFKWKPNDENTIDFLVSVKKDKDGNDFVGYGMVNGRPISYKEVILKIGYNPKQHNRYNAFRVMNESLIYDDNYYPIPFQPTNPYMKDAYILYAELENGVMKCKDGTIFSDGDIIECLYNSKSTGHIDKWIPTRVRDVLSPNDFMTANSVWKSFHYPITHKNITTGEIDNNGEEIYYFNINNRKDLSTLAINELHGYIKKQLIAQNSVKGDILLDLSCGKLGDMHHWLNADLSMCVGMDLNRDNLENIDNGACVRVLNKMAADTNPLLENILLLWGDSSKDMLSTQAGKDTLNKYYLDVIYGNVPVENIQNNKLRRFHNIGNTSSDGNNGFNVVSCQFSIHYFFKNEIDLNQFLKNVSDNLKKGGVFVGTCFNGGRIFEALETSDEGILQESIEGKPIWKIIKKYDQHQFMANSKSLGMIIDVYYESIGTTTPEYLVNMEYLKTKCMEYKLKLVDNKGFQFLHDAIMKAGSFKPKNTLNEALSRYSFFNDYFIFEKI
jgi:hypothetical protein